MNTAVRSPILQILAVGLAGSFGEKTTFAAALAALLVSSFGWAPAIATVIAALAVKLFCQPGYEVACRLWKEKLPK